MLQALLLLACLQDQPVRLQPHWSVGPLLRLELVKGREDWEEERLVRSSKTVTPIEVEVLAKSETGWVVRWTFGHTSVVEGGGKDKDYAEHMASLNEGMHLDVRLAPSGSVVGLADPEALQRHYSRMLQQVEKGLLDKGMEKNLVGQMMRDATARVLGPGFEHASLTEVELFHRCFTRPLVPGRKESYEGELPNPLFGDPFPARGSCEPAALEAGAKQLSVRFTLAIDPQKTRDLIQAWLSESAKQSGKPPPQAPEDLPIKALGETTQFVLDLENCLPRNVEYERTTAVDKHKRIDRTLLRVLQQPAKEAPR